MKKEGDHEGSEDHQTKPGSRIPDLEKMNAEREEKMARFRFAALIKYLYNLKGYIIRVKFQVFFMSDSQRYPLNSY